MVDFAGMPFWPLNRFVDSLDTTDSQLAYHIQRNIFSRVPPFSYLWPAFQDRVILKSVLRSGFAPNKADPDAATQFYSPRSADRQGRPTEREVVVGPLHGRLSLRRLNEATAAQAASDPAAFRARSEAANAEGELELTLAPYEVVRIDPAA